MRIKEFGQEFDFERNIFVDSSVIDCYKGGGGKGSKPKAPPPPPPPPLVINPEPPVERESANDDKKKTERNTTRQSKSKMNIPLASSDTGLSSTKTGLKI